MNLIDKLLWTVLAAVPVACIFSARKAYEDFRLTYDTILGRTHGVEGIMDPSETADCKHVFLLEDYICDKCGVTKNSMANGHPACLVRLPPEKQLLPKDLVPMAESDRSRAEEMLQRALGTFVDKGPRADDFPVEADAEADTRQLLDLVRYGAGNQYSLDRRFSDPGTARAYARAMERHGFYVAVQETGFEGQSQVLVGFSRRYGR